MLEHEIAGLLYIAMKLLWLILLFLANLSCGVLYHGNQNQDWQSRENKETKKSEVNLDTVFQIVDKLHHSSPKIRMVKL